MGRPCSCIRRRMAIGLAIPHTSAPGVCSSRGRELGGYHKDGSIHTKALCDPALWMPPMLAAPFGWHQPAFNRILTGAPESSPRMLMLPEGPSWWR